MYRIMLMFPCFRMEQYYIDVVDMIDGEGGDALKEERDRLNIIITSCMSHT